MDWRGMGKKKPGTQPEGQAPSLVGVMVGAALGAAAGQNPGHMVPITRRDSFVHHPCETCRGGLDGRLFDTDRHMVPSADRFFDKIYA